MSLGLSLALGLGARNSAGPFSPATLFAAGEQGYWLDPSDLSTMFQDTAGTQPVTAAGQSVALMLDKSGRGNHATQANLAQRPLYQIDANGRPFLLFDGSDDGMATGNIVPGTNKAQVFAGVRKLSDAAAGSLCNFATSVNNGSFELLAPLTAGTYRFGTRGTVEAIALASGFAAPITNILTALGDISAPSAILRVNGTQSAVVNTTQGTGNYLTYPLFIGRRGGVSIPLNGRIYGLIVRFGANLSADQITQTETWLNQRTGAF